MSRRSCFFGISLFLMCVAWTGATLVESRPATALAEPLENIDLDIQGWVGRNDPPLTVPVLDTLRPTSYVLRTYTKGSKALGFFIAYYALTRPGESMHSPKNCLPGGGWEILESGTTYIQVQGRHFPVNKYVVQKEAARELVLYWYQSRRHVVASEYTGKLFRFWDAITAGDTSGSIVRVSSPEGLQGLEDARSFAAAVFPEVQQAIGQ